ncbi:MAG: rod shape-determining protein MreC [Treponema sp.]|jgi:rod shape-determining protein MreC|nr:rod shape-determining protein MreC [Treponema sp.]
MLNDTLAGLRKKYVTPRLVVFIILMLVSFSLLFFSTRSFIINFKDVGLSAYSGMRGGLREVGAFVSRTVNAVKALSTLRQEYAELQERVARYEQLERNAAEILQENLRLREQLQFSRSLGYRHIPAALTGRDPDNLFSALVINKGRHSGVTQNMPVIAWQNGVQALVGKVVQAGQFESLVMPVYDLSFFASARLSASRYEGIVEGQGERERPLLMRFIIKRAKDDIAEGDLVSTSGMGGVYPAGINIGRVSRTIYEESEMSMELELAALIDFSRLEYVFVIGHDDAGGAP